MEIRQMIRQLYYLRKMANKTGSPYLQQNLTWKVLQKAVNKGEKSTVINQIDRGGQVTEKQEILEICNENFVSIGEKLAAEIPPSVDSSLHYLLKTKEVEAKISFKNRHPNQVHRLLDKLETGKASGMDLMSNKFLNIAKNILAKSLCDIFNASIENKSFHRILKLLKWHLSLKVA